MMMGKYLGTIKKLTETLIHTSKKGVGIGIKVEKTKYMLLSCHQNAGENTDKESKNVAQFKYLAFIVTNQNLIQKKIKRRLHFGNACFH
jgi:hypothetical protein